MYVHSTYNLYIIMYMYIACTYMFTIVGNLVNMYRHVCTMFSDVRTVLPILVQVVRIPDYGTSTSAISYVFLCTSYVFLCTSYVFLCFFQAQNSVYTWMIMVYCIT